MERRQVVAAARQRPPLRRDAHLSPQPSRLGLLAPPQVPFPERWRKRLAHPDAVVFGAHDLSASGDPNAGRPRGGSHANVGEAVVVVVPRAEDGLFKYAEENRAEASWRDEPLPPGLGVVPPDWGSAERGAFSYSKLTPRQPGVAAIGLYFYEGRLGV